MNKIGYIRVSTEEQNNEGYSLEYQKNQIDNYFKNELSDSNYMLVDDGGYSATNLKRPGIRQIIDAIHKKEIDIFVFWNTSRLSRNVSDLNAFIKVALTNGVKLVNLSERIDYRTTHGELVGGILGALSQYESKNISVRTKAAFEAMARLGFYPYGGRRPFGFNLSNKILSINEKEMIIVKRIFELRMNGNSFHEIRSKIATEYHFYKNRSWFEKIPDKTIYFGYILVGENMEHKIHIIDPIINEQDYIERIKNLKDHKLVKRRKRVPKKNYKYVGLVYIEGRIMKAQKVYKKSKNGTTKSYVYYYDRESSCYINQKMIDQVLFTSKSKSYVDKLRNLSDKIGYAAINGDDTTELTKEFNSIISKSSSANSRLVKKIIVLCPKKKYLEVQF